MFGKLSISEKIRFDCYPQHTKIGGITLKKQLSHSNPHYTWDMENGSFKFEGQDVMIFWVETALKSFVDTIEEVSGNDAATVVMETAGFRMGKIVSDFFNQGNSEDIIYSLPEIYASAGWGVLEVVEFSAEKATAVIRMRESWEYKINKLQGKEETGAFIPGHLAGILSGLFEKTTGYQVRKSQLEGDAYDEYYFFHSDRTPVKNIHEYIRQKEQEEIQQLEQKVEERTRQLTDLVSEISSPIIPVLDNIVVVPMLGKYDEMRANEMINRTLTDLPNHAANYLILDLTGIDEEIDEYTLSLVQNLTNATALLGTKCVLVGISPQLGVKITNSGFDLTDLDCFSNLKHAIYFALAQQGKQIIG